MYFLFLLFFIPFLLSRPIISNITGCITSSYGPTYCNRTGSDSITINGYNFSTIANIILVGGGICTPVTYIDYYRIECNLPEGYHPNTPVIVITGPTTFGIAGPTVSYKQCLPGQYVNSTNQVQCIDCPRGSYSTDFSSSYCLSCPPSTYNSYINATACITCSAGYEQKNIGGTICNKCLSGTYSLGTDICLLCKDSEIAPYDGSSSCKSCPISSFGANNHTECHCIAGYYGIFNNNTLSCVECPTGAQCNTSGVFIYNILPDPGYFPEVTGSNKSFIACYNSACQGGKLGCFPGFGGNLCTNCQSGLGRLNIFDCAYCPRLVQNFLILFIGLILILFYAAFGVLSAQQNPFQVHDDQMESYMMLKVESNEKKRKELEARQIAEENGTSFMSDTFGALNIAAVLKIKKESSESSATVVPMVTMTPNSSEDDDSNGIELPEDDVLVDLTEYVVIQKIIASFYQVNSIALNFNFVWPDFLTGIYQSETTTGVVITTSLYSMDCFLKQVFGASVPYALSTPILLAIAPVGIIIVPLFILYTRTNSKLAELDRYSVQPNPDKRDVMYRTLIEHRELKAEAKQHAYGNLDKYLYENKEFYLKVESQLHRDLLDFKDPNITEELYYSKMKVTKYESQVLKARILSHFISDDMTIRDFLLKFYAQKNTEFINTLLKPWRYDEAYKSAQGYYISIVLVGLFLFHPNITTEAFKLFSCINIGVDPLNDVYLLTDLQTKCWVGEHLNWIKYLGIPMILLEVIGIPFLAWSLLYYNRNIIKGPEPLHRAWINTRNFTFLYWSYDTNAYFWEVVVTMRKVLVIGISIFFQYDVQTQTLLFVLVIVCFLLGHISVAPFKQDIGDQLETISLSVSFITFFFGQFLYLTDKFDKPLRILISFVIALINFAFFIAAIYIFIIKLKPYLEYMVQLQAKKLSDLVDNSKFDFDTNGDEEMVVIDKEKLKMQKEEQEKYEKEQAIKEKERQLAPFNPLIPDVKNSQRILVVGFLVDCRSNMNNVKVIPRKLLQDLSKSIDFPLTHMKVTLVRFRGTDCIMHIQFSEIPVNQTVIEKEFVGFKPELYTEIGGVWTGINTLWKDKDTKNLFHSGEVSKYVKDVINVIPF